MARAVQTEALENLRVLHLLSVSSLNAKHVFSTFLQTLPFPEKPVHVAEAQLSWNGGRGAVSHKHCAIKVQLTDHWTNSWGCIPSDEEPQSAELQEHLSFGLSLSILQKSCQAMALLPFIWDSFQNVPAV